MLPIHYPPGFWHGCGWSGGVSVGMGWGGPSALVGGGEVGFFLGLRPRLV